MSRQHLIACIIAGVHLTGVGLTMLYVSTSTAGQAPLIWVYWAFLDFPMSLLYPILNDNVLLVHGIFGTAWWYGLTIILVRVIAMLQAVLRRR